MHIKFDADKIRSVFKIQIIIRRYLILSYLFKHSNKEEQISF